MRWNNAPLSLILLTIAGLSSVNAAPPGEPAAAALKKTEPPPAAAVQTSAADTASQPPAKVIAPEIPELSSVNFWGTVEKGYWFVKHYSPTCPHCIAAAPIWQALADYYTTSTPLTDVPSSPKSNPDSPSANPSFAETYDFHFASINCVANGDICGDAALDIHAYPTFILLKDGKVLEKYTDHRHDLPTLSQFVEKHLELIKPGSRPTTPIEFPDDSGKAEKKKPAEEATAKEEEVEAEEPAEEEVAAEDEETPAEETAVTAPGTPAPKKATPNPNGHSVPLDAEEFQRLVTTTRDGWFIKFYAPWCGHCQAMAPAWAELGKEMQGELNIGEVNCDIEKRLCRDISLRGYPTILYFQNGERVEYDGLRGLGDLVSYARKAVDSGVKEVDLTTFEEMEKTGELEVAFLYFYDKATTSEDFEALERLTLNLIGHAPLLKTKSEALSRRFRINTWPRLIVIRDGRPSYYTALSPRDLRDYNRVLHWMKSVWLPIVPELSAANSHEIMNHRTVVLGILSRERAGAFAQAKKELKEAALEFMDQRQTEEKNEKKELRDKKQIKIEEAEDRGDDRALRAAKNTKVVLSERKDVGFAWVDAVFWDRWVRTTYGINVAEDGERIIINDEDTKQFWDTTIDGTPITPSRSTILETLQTVLHTPYKLKSKYTSSRLESLFFSAKIGASGHPWLTLIGLVLVVLVASVWGRGKLRRGRGGFFKLDGKEGLLGGPPSAGGKFD